MPVNAISEVFGLQDALDAKAGREHTHANSDMPVATKFVVLRLVSHAYSSGNSVGTVINVNSSTFTATNGVYFHVDLDVFPFTHYRILGLGESNAAGQTISLQLASYAAPGSPIHIGGNDVPAIPNTIASIDSGWLSRDDEATGLKEYGVVHKGSNATVDISYNYLSVMLKIA